MPDTSTRWLSYNETQCLEISGVLPYDNQPYSLRQQVFDNNNNNNNNNNIK